MRIFRTLSIGAGVFSIAEALPGRAQTLAERQITDLREDGYDFVIIGGGTAGLTVADRISAAFPESTL